MPNFFATLLSIAGAHPNLRVRCRVLDLLLPMRPKEAPSSGLAGGRLGGVAFEFEIKSDPSPALPCMHGREHRPKIGSQPNP